MTHARQCAVAYGVDAGMFIPDAKQYLGRNIAVAYRDRHGNLHMRSMHVHGVAFVPVYGGCLISEGESIWLNAVISISAIE